MVFPFSPVTQSAVDLLVASYKGPSFLLLSALVR